MGRKQTPCPFCGHFCEQYVTPDKMLVCEDCGARYEPAMGRERAVVRCPVCDYEYVWRDGEPLPTVQHADIPNQHALVPAVGREQVPPEALCGCTRKNHGSVIWQCPNRAGPVSGSCEDCRHNRCPGSDTRETS